MRYSLITILLSFSLFTQAQNNRYHFTNYTTANGLSNSSVNCIIKDTRNFIWLGTDEGLNRFDGNRFVSYFSDHDDPASLSGNIIFDILQYQPGHLLIGTNNGLSIFNTFSNRFENDKIRIRALQKGSGTYVRSFFKDKQQRVYINHSGVIDVFNDTLAFQYRLTDLPWARSLQKVLINKEAWMQDSQNRIWLPTDNMGLCIIDEKNQQVYCGTNNPMNYPFMMDHAPIRSFLYDEEQQVVWYSVWGNGLEKYNLKTRQHQQQLFNLPIGNESRCINALTKEKNGRLLCGGGQAIYSVDPATLEFYISNDNADANSLPAFLGSSILNDTTHIWIGTETKGLMKLPAGESNVEQLPLPYKVHDYTNTCSAILRSQNGKIYLAYWRDGLIELDPINHQLHNYRFSERQGKTEDIIRLCEDKQGRLWIGNTNGFFVYDKTTKTFKRPNWLPASVRSLNISSMFCDSRGNVWVSFRTPNALGVYDASENKFHYYERYRVNNQPVFDTLSAISRITEDEKGNIWMTSYKKGEIACFEPGSRQWKLYPRPQSKSALVMNYGLNSICPAGKNAIWLTNDIGLGLAKYDYFNDSISFITRKNGLLSDNIQSVSRGSGNELFLVSKAGINLFNPVTNEIRSLRLNDQNVNLSFAYQQFYDSINHQLIYGLNDRILVIKDAIWQSVSNIQTTWVDNITVNNAPAPIDLPGQKLALRYFEKNITINFSSVNYTENSSLTYAYKMEGADGDWITSSLVPSANYANLSPGHYRFLVKAKNQTGEWGAVNDSLQIVIAPPFWRTWWFIASAFAVAALSVYWVFRKRVKTIRHEAEMKQTIAETEMMALRAQMNPHFIFNCLNSIDNLIQTDQKEKATDYLAKFARLIRAILENSKNNTIPCWKDLEALQLYLQMEELRWDKKIVCDVSIANEIQNGDYKVPPMIIQPFVENAIHHGLLNKIAPDKKLVIDVKVESNKIKYTITDNGVGRRQAAEYKKLNRFTGTSFGLQITEDRINLFNQGSNGAVKITDLYNDRQVPEGTRVEVWLTTQPSTA